MAPNAYTAEHPHDHWWDPHNPLNDKQKAVFMDWIEQGMDFFGCDENVPKQVFGVDRTPRIPLEPHKETDPQRFDYSKLHDDLLESLMSEQTKKASDPNNTSLTDFDSSASSFSFSNASSNSQSLLNTSTSTANSSFEFKKDEETTALSEMSNTNTNKRGHKRPRALKLHRRVMPALVTKNGEEKTMKRRHSLSGSSFNNSNKPAPTKNTNIRETIKKKYSSSDAVRVNLMELKDANFPPASSFIHPQCRLQKDKGKGEPAGSNICAKGRDHCLLKLEQKMALLTKIAFGEASKHKGKADMKRRPARIAEVFPNFTETRSIIELRMGFLSMQYGVLLRWDTTRTGKVTLVVLRKMCHESFYSICKPPSKKKPVSPRKMLQTPSEPPCCAIRNVINGNHAILQRPDGLEVALLEPPYRVDRPAKFEPSVLSVAVQYGTGLGTTSQWTVQLCYDGKTENVLLTWDADQDSFTPKLGGTLKHEIPSDASLELHSLEIRLFEHPQQKKGGKSRRCVSHMHVPLVGLEAQRSNQNAMPRDLKVVSTHDPDAHLTISVLLESDYAFWLNQELDARRREEVRAFVWKAPVHRTVRVVDIYESSPEFDGEEDDGIWEWICGAC